jgi:Bacteriophage HK97-gp10, putative tail-component
MPDSIEFKGWNEALAELELLPDQLRRTLLEATKEASGVLVDALRSQSPVAAIARPRVRKGNVFPAGSLLRGWTKRVVETIDGAEGTVKNKVYYESFVERGAHPGHPMRANPITARGVALSTGTIEAIYETDIRAVVELANQA